MSTATPVFEELRVGDSAPPLMIEGVTRTHFVRYAGASGDFNPMHHDDTLASKAGQPSVFGHGMLTAGWLARVVKDWLGPTALRRFGVRFAKPVWPGDTLTCTATVTALRDEAGEAVADLDCKVVNQAGETCVTGTATAVVARRG